MSEPVVSEPVVGGGLGASGGPKPPRRAGPRNDGAEPNAPNRKPPGSEPAAGRAARRWTTEHRAAGRHPTGGRGGGGGGACPDRCAIGGISQVPDVSLGDGDAEVRDHLRS